MLQSLNQLMTNVILFSFGNLPTDLSCKSIGGMIKKYVQKEQQRHENDAIDVVLLSLLLTLTTFHTLLYVSGVKFKHAIAGWDEKKTGR